ncbi:ABC transporter permease [Litoribacter populi]|uniref:ABC transporter permease n=1 Tax=Litoribacter populi TaxID=2598460 RepID=UPI00117E22AE|nr:ABC transporter permease [Litoribacter populi]
MWKNYLKIAWRNLFRNRLTSILYVSGLGIALLCVMFIGIYVHHEKSFDQFLPEADLIYRVNIDGKMGPEEFVGGNTPPPVGKALVNNFPEVADYTRLYLNSPEYVSFQDGTDNKIFMETRMFSVDTNFLSFFQFQMLEGDVNSSLIHPYSVVLTESTAKKYFGNQSALGKELHFDEWSKPFLVTAVLEDLPSNSSIQFDLLIPNEANPVVQRFDWSWVWLQMNTFVKLHPESANPETVAKIEAKLPSIVKLLAAGAFERIGKPFDEFIANGGRWDLLLQPMEDIHLGSSGIFSNQISHGNATTVNAFIFTALLILVMACINCMNLTTAKAIRRSKEVAVKKVLGSARQQLIGQFLVEAALFSFLASVTAIFMMVYLLPFFNQLTGKPFLINDLFTTGHLLAFLGLFLVTSLFSGLYPAFYLSGFRPMTIFKRNSNPSSIFSEQTARNGLVVFQFVISTALIISSIVIFKQIQYANQMNLGFDKEQVLLLNQVEKAGGSQAVLTEELRQMAGIQNASLSTGVPGKNTYGDFYMPMTSEDETDLVKDLALGSFMVDEQYVTTMGMELLFGRDFSLDFNDSTSVILNETAIWHIGWTPESAVGNYIQYPGNRNQMFEVIGVVKDFNTESLHSQIMPFGLFHFSSKSYYPRQLFITLRLEKGNLTPILESIEDKWGTIVSTQPYDATFLDDEIEAMYQSDRRAGFTFWLFTVLAVLIGCIGLFGLVMATIEQRVREIGVRKVLGASEFHIVGILSKDYVKLVICAILIASPLAWFAMEYWLEQFAYKVEIQIGYFVLAFLVAIIFSFPTILVQTWRAAMSNPVDSLKSE